MAIQQQQQQFTRTNNFIDLSTIQGSGANTGRYLTDVTGILVGIEPRTGTYTFHNPRTNQDEIRPQSWTAHFEDGSMFSWPTYVDQQTGEVKPWSRFDQSINLAQCVATRTVIHLWRDERNFTHLEVAEEQQVNGVQQLAGNWRQPMQQPQQQGYQQQPQQLPWQN